MILPLKEKDKTAVLKYAPLYPNVPVQYHLPQPETIYLIPIAFSFFTKNSHPQRAHGTEVQGHLLSSLNFDMASCYFILRPTQKTHNNHAKGSRSLEADDVMEKRIEGT